MLLEETQRPGKSYTQDLFLSKRIRTAKQNARKKKRNVVFCSVRKKHTRGILREYYLSKTFWKFCRTFEYPYPELLEVLV